MKILSIYDIHGKLTDNVVYCEQCLEHCLGIQPLHEREHLNDTKEKLKCDFCGCIGDSDS
jgi:hypothetical protein